MNVVFQVCFLGATAGIGSFDLSEIQFYHSYQRHHHALAVLPYKAALGINSEQLNSL